MLLLLERNKIELNSLIIAISILNEVISDAVTSISTNSQILPLLIPKDDQKSSNRNPHRSLELFGLAVLCILVIASG